MRNMELITLIYKQLFKINTKNNSIENLQRIWTTNSQLKELKKLIVSNNESISFHQFHNFQMLYVQRI